MIKISLKASYTGEPIFKLIFKKNKIQDCTPLKWCTHLKDMSMQNFIYSKSHSLANGIICIHYMFYLTFCSDPLLSCWIAKSKCKRIFSRALQIMW